MPLLASSCLSVYLSIRSTTASIKQNPTRGTLFIPILFLWIVLNFVDIIRLLSAIGQQWPELYMKTDVCLWTVAMVILRDGDRTCSPWGTWNFSFTERRCPLYKVWPAAKETVEHPASFTTETDCVLLEVRNQPDERFELDWLPCT